jgi:hypothetical protein
MVSPLLLLEPFPAEVSEGYGKTVMMRTYLRDCARDVDEQSSEVKDCSKKKRFSQSRFLLTAKIHTDDDNEGDEVERTNVSPSLRLIPVKLLRPPQRPRQHPLIINLFRLKAGDPVPLIRRQCTQSRKKKGERAHRT